MLGNAADLLCSPREDLLINTPCDIVTSCRALDMSVHLLLIREGNCKCAVQEHSKGNAQCYNQSLRPSACSSSNVNAPFPMPKYFSFVPERHPYCSSLPYFSKPVVQVNVSAWPLSA
jgi:hypothetical protein